MVHRASVIAKTVFEIVCDLADDLQWCAQDCLLTIMSGRRKSQKPTKQSRKVRSVEARVFVLVLTCLVTFAGQG